MDSPEELKKTLNRLKNELKELYFEKMNNQRKVNQKLRFFGKEELISNIEKLNAEIELKLMVIKNQKEQISLSGTRFSKEELRVLTEKEHYYLFQI